MTIEVEIKLPNVPDGKQRGYIHSEVFPFMRKDNFVIMITNADGTRILNYDRLFFRENKHTWTMQFRPQDVMKMHLQVHVKSDAYKGLDVVQDLIVDIEKPDEKAAEPEFRYNKKDLKEIQKKLILGQEVVMNPDQQDSDEELEDEYKHEAEEDDDEGDED